MFNVIVTVLFPLLFLGTPQGREKVASPQVPCCKSAQAIEDAVQKFISIYGVGAFCDMRQSAQTAQVRHPRYLPIKNSIPNVFTACATPGSIRAKADSADKEHRVIMKLVETFNSLYKQKKYRDAHRIAEVAKLLYPENPVAVMAFEMSRMAMTLSANTISSKVYPVADLVVPIEVQTGNTVTGITTCENKLIDLITQNVEPGSWLGKGGKGAIQYFPLGHSLVIQQSRAVQRQIAELLAALRRMQERQVVLETYVISATPQAAARLRTHFGGQKCQQKKQTRDGAWLLNHQQVKAMLAQLQSDQSSNVQQLPRATVFDGQTFRLESMERHAYVADVKKVDSPAGLQLEPLQKSYKTGVLVEQRPLISADQRSVRLSLNATVSKLQDNGLISSHFQVDVIDLQKCKKGSGPCSTDTFTVYTAKPKLVKINVETNLKIPFGKTAVIQGCTYKMPVRQELGVPILSSLPYISRLFKNVAYSAEDRVLLVMVKPSLV